MADAQRKPWFEINKRPALLKKDAGRLSLLDLSMLSYSDQRVGVFIDTQNMYYSARSIFGRKVNFNNIVKEAVGECKLIQAIAYVVRTKSEEEKPFIDALSNAGIKLREKELMEYLSGQKKADWDVGLTVDVIRMLDMLDVIVLVSGDGDFHCLIKYLFENKKLEVLIIPNRYQFSALLKFRIFRPYLRFMNDLKERLSYKRKDPGRTKP